MNNLGSGYEQHLKPLMVRFCMAAALLLAVAIACISQQRSQKLLEKTLAELTRARSGLALVKEATANRKLVLATLQSQLGQGGRDVSPEMLLYGKIDEINSRLHPDDIIITAVEKKGGEASLPYTLTFNNPDFNSLLNAIGYLHSDSFPLTPINSITVTQSSTGGTAGVSCKITGKVFTIEKTKP